MFEHLGSQAQGHYAVGFYPAVPGSGPPMPTQRSRSFGATITSAVRQTARSLTFPRSRARRADYRTAPEPEPAFMSTHSTRSGNANDAASSSAAALGWVPLPTLDQDPIQMVCCRHSVV